MDNRLESYKEQVIFKNILFLEISKIKKKILSSKTYKKWVRFCLILRCGLTCSNIEY